MRLSVPIYHLKRRARELARAEKIPLHMAQDRVAADEGFARWSLLASRYSETRREGALLEALSPGDMLLIGARPGQGKTRLGLQLLVDAARAGRRSVLFTLEYSAREARERVLALAGPAKTLPEIVTSEEICADFIVRHLSDAPKGSVAVIDYLQILDQQRTKPPLAEQVTALQSFARGSGAILGFISQIDRSFDPAVAGVPGIDDLRLPNPIPAGVFTKACFLHAGELRLQRLS